MRDVVFALQWLGGSPGKGPPSMCTLTFLAYASVGRPAGALTRLPTPPPTPWASLTSVASGTLGGGAQRTGFQTLI